MQILILVDKVEKQSLLERLVSQQGHTFRTTQNGRQGLDIVGEDHIDMVICTPSLQDLGGFDVIQKTRQMSLDHHVFMLMLIDRDDVAQMTTALAKGADNVVAWPSHPLHLMTAVINAGRIIDLENEIDRNRSAIHRNHAQTVTAFGQLIESFSDKLGAHGRRVAELSVALAKMHPDIVPDDYETVEACALLHDIGMIGLPLSLVEKRRTEFTGEENELYRSHPQRGAAILDPIDSFGPVAGWIRMHHEQFNGRGFPDELSGDQIPLAAAIVGASSLYDDLLVKEHIDRKEAAHHLQQFRGYQLSPALVDMLLELNLSLLQAGVQKNDISCHVVDLKKGMVLSRTILTKSGASVMSAGTRLDPPLITKLKRYYESGNIIESVFIRK
ncbi:HD domain-containing phosphohydrolase [Desulfatitalea tepidiphila]|uniref:HD domain-containing phosphohydrolase n=1 Tax=Desulfatitalea tepidiphila TaxID=1185843 RepID=UPI0006B40DFB|nr:HD domain-containing phosphohydrolase [Desulfatitalea tepidiphila]